MSLSGKYIFLCKSELYGLHKKTRFFIYNYERCLRGIKVI